MSLTDDLKLALKFEECNKTSRRFFGDKYPEKIKTYIDMIKNHMFIADIKNPIEATMKICQLPAIHENGMAMMLIMSACYDITTGNE